MKLRTFTKFYAFAEALNRFATHNDNKFGFKLLHDDLKHEKTM